MRLLPLLESCEAIAIQRSKGRKPNLYRLNGTILSPLAQRTVPDCHRSTVNGDTDVTVTSDELSLFSPSTVTFSTGNGDTGVTPTRPKEQDPKKGKRKDSNGANLSPLPEALDTPEFQKAWEEWIAYRKERRQPLTASTVRKQFAELAAWGPTKAVTAIERSIRNGWQGLFDPEEKKNGQHQRNANGLTDARYRGD